MRTKKFSLPKNEIDVLVIGHGSKDPNAQMSLKYVVDGLAKQYRNAEYCFLEIEQPDINSGIKSCKKNNPKALVWLFFISCTRAHM